MAKTHIIAGIIVLIIVLAMVYFFLPKSSGLSTIDKLTSFTGSTATGTCSDSDGSNFFTKGVTISIASGSSATHMDRCVTSDSIMEGSCANGKLVKTEKRCDKGCVDGACAK